MSQSTHSPLDRAIYTLISRNRGLKAREIARLLGEERGAVNHALYASPLMRELCWQDRDYCWHSQIPHTVPHYGLREFSGYYSSAEEFLQLEEDEWLERLKEGCERIGRNLNDTRGLIHSFLDCRTVMRQLFADLEMLMGDSYRQWELVFELRIKRSKMIRIYADVLVVSPRHVFSLEFKMKDTIAPEEVAQAAKYCPYLELVFGPDYEVVPVLVLTRGTDLYTTYDLPRGQGFVPVCSGDLLFNVVNEYLRFLPEDPISKGL